MPKPMSRDEMRELKAKKDEEKRLRTITSYVTQIYQNAIQLAESFSHTQYTFCIDSNNCMVNHMVDAKFCRDNMDEILAALQDLFPGCYVTHTMMSTGKDGKMYDISKMDPAIRQFATQSKECIIVDWS